MLRLKRNPQQHWLWFGAAALAVAGMVYLLSPILAPFMAAAILAYILDPLVERLERRRVPRTLATLLILLAAMALVALALLIVLPLFYKESVLLYQQLPGAVDLLNNRITPWMKDSLGIDINFDAGSVRRFIADNLQDAGDIAQRVLGSLKVGGMAVIGFAVNLLLVPVVLFYLLRDWRVLLVRIDALLPRRWHTATVALAREIDAVLAEFLRGQIAVMLIMSVFYVAGLWLAGLQFALPIGLVTGMLVFVPYLGMATGLLLATLAASMQFGALPGLLVVWGVFALGQIGEGVVVTPWLVGERIGLHPVAVIFALLAFGQIFGFFGILLALPASAALLIGLRHLRARYLAGMLYRR
jgi:predicted PurR-regulated permease PerM